jgi:hypothetical protein
MIILLSLVVSCEIWTVVSVSFIALRGSIGYGLGKSCYISSAYAGLGRRLEMRCVKTWASGSLRSEEKRWTTIAI